MRFGIDVAQHQLTWPELLERVRFAEDAGFDGAWVFDHFAPLYGRRDGPSMEAWSLLAALSAATTRIRLGALVSGVTYRYPSILATQCATIDQISNGRLEIGLGAAWHEEEHKALGLRFPPTGERARRLEEAVQVIRKLLTEDRASFAGRYYRLERATYRPRPVQRPHPPIWIGASGERLMLPIVARQADVWHDYGSPTSFRRKSALLDELASRAGRDPHAIARSSTLDLSQSWDDVRRDAAAYAKVGVSYLVVSWPSEGRRHLEHFATKVMPELG